MTRHLCGLGVLWGLLAVTALAPGQAPTISDATGGAAGTLTAEQKQQVDAFWAYQAKLMVETKEPKDILASRRAITAAYAGGTGEGFRAYFAESAASNFAAKALQSKRALTLVNASLALSSLKRPEAVAALDQMVAHPNAAVRYWGVRGYTAIRAAMLNAGKTEAGKLVKTLTDRVGKETSPVVAGLLFEALDFSVGKNASRETLAVSMDLMAKGVARHLQPLRDGDGSTAMAYLGAVKASASMAGYATSGQRIVLLKALGEILANAGAAYADGASSPKWVKAKSPDPAIEALGMLLIQCEEILGRMVGTDVRPVRDAVTSIIKATRATKVRDAVAMWIGTAAAPGTLGQVNVPAITPLAPTPPEEAKDAGSAPNPALPPVPAPAPAPANP